METFAVDKCFYDIGANDLRDLWDTDLDPSMEVLRTSTTDVDIVEWQLLDRDPLLPGVVLHDRLMTSAALNGTPIKTEHSYSLNSDGDSMPGSPVMVHGKIDIEDDFPTICVNPTSVRLSPVTIAVKDEPLSDPDSPASSCPASPLDNSEDHNSDHTMELKQETAEIDIEMDTDSMLESMSKEIFKQTFDTPYNKILLGRQPAFSMSKVSIKVEPNTGFVLPPTPPSCSSSEESEDNAPCSQPSSPPRGSRINTRVLLTSHTTTRQPIHTPLISSQPKGSTGTLVLTEEEKRTLMAEGYPVPTRLPLTKAEEKSLKKIRRKIKNKISAQESRRKKKEYMDQLERKVEILVSENSAYRKKIENLEDSNNNLLNQLAKLQAIVARTHPQVVLRHAK